MWLDLQMQPLKPGMLVYMKYNTGLHSLFWFNLFTQLTVVLHLVFGKI